MLPGSIITGKDTPESEFIAERREATSDSLPGRFVDTHRLLIVGFALLFIGVGLLAISVVASGGQIPASEKTTEFVEKMTFVLGVITLAASLVFLGLWGHIAAEEADRALVTEDSSNDQPYQDSGFSSVAYREVVKVRCRYCGTLNDVDRKTCIACGATL